MEERKKQRENKYLKNNIERELEEKTKELQTMMTENLTKLLIIEEKSKTRG